MATKRPHFTALSACVIAATAAGLLASCAPSNRPPETVSAQNPSVTYKYRGDQELLRANQQAAAFCNQYGTTPRTVNLTNNPDGTNTVVFECVKVGAPTTAIAPAAPPLSTNPALTYSYRSERELLDAASRADAYCMQSGQRMVSTSTMVANPDGSRTVSFQCGPSISVLP